MTQLAIAPVSRHAVVRAARRWVRGHLGAIDHERRVAFLADRLFKLTLPLHHLPRSDRRLLHLGAIMHDVGRVNGNKGHAKTGARMILDEPRLALKDGDRELLAFLARHHRGKIPTPGCEKHLSFDLPPGALRRARVLQALLRAADSLDCRALPAPRIEMALQDRILAITICTATDLVIAHTSFAKPKKLAMLEAILRCRVRVFWLAAD